jgi:hypothetical protein
MKRFSPIITPPNINYLKELAESGSMPVDVELTKIRDDLARVTVFFSGADPVMYYFEITEDLWNSFWDAVAFSGYGKRGLGNIIHHEALQMARHENLEPWDLTVAVSPEIRDRFGHTVEHWTDYGYTFIVDPTLNGAMYTIRLPS